METSLNRATNEKAPEAPATHPVASPRSWHPIQALLQLRAIETFRHREFRLLWMGQVFTGMGTWMDQVTRGWLIYELTDSPVQLGLVRGIQAIPILLLSPLAGSIADRSQRKMQMLVAQVLDGLMYATLAILIITDRIQPWHVYATAFGAATVQTFQQPARAAMVSDAVPRGLLTNAIGLNAVVFNGARTTGPALAGLLIAIFGTAGSYAVQAVLYVLATIWTVPLRPEQPFAYRSHRHSAAVSLGHSIIEGWKFSWQNETVRAGLLVTTFASLFIIPFTTLLPVFARDILGVGATGQGLLLTAMGIGALCSAALIASLGDRLPKGIVMLAGVTLYGLTVIAFSSSPWFKLSLVLMTIIGLTHVTSHALVQTVIQLYSPSEFRGRTMAIFHMSQVLLTLGSMLVGTLAALWGAQAAVASMALAGALTTIAIYVVLPRARLIQ